LMTLGRSRTTYVEFTASMDETGFVRCDLIAWRYSRGVAAGTAG
jgi:transposase